jgi:glycosyltransferase involved in cell wall biosynthesis
MKVLFLNTYDNMGGAARATYRLFEEMRTKGVNVKLGVMEKKTSDSDVLLLRLWRNKTIGAKLRYKYLSMLKWRHKKTFSTSNLIFHSENLLTHVDIDYINNSDFDLVHLHWINDDFISIEDIARINKPLVWTMHDSWPVCGAEHHPNILEKDERFAVGYARANKPATTLGTDICRQAWLRKMVAWKNLRCYFVAPSIYEQQILVKSALAHYCGLPCKVIPNVIPTQAYRPLDKKYLRKLLQIPDGKKIIGFGADHYTGDKMSIKGGNFLIKSLEKIKSKNKYHGVMFGRIDSEFVSHLPLPVTTMGYVSHDYLLSIIYNICDVFVCPSVIESFGNVCLEAMSCGVPVAAFRTGGIPDIVEHKKTGYLAKLFDTDDLAHGILYCLENQSKLSAAGIIKAKRDFDTSKIVKQHLQVYQQAIDDWHKL